MSNDLISRSELLKCLSMNDKEQRIPEYDCGNFAVTIPIKDFKNIIRRQPTAYDIDKVVEELEVGRFLTCSDVTYGVSKYIEIEKAIDIVKRGGIDERM